MKEYYLILTANSDLYDDHGNFSTDNIIRAVHNKKSQIQEYLEPQQDKEALKNYASSEKSRFFPHGALINLRSQSPKDEGSDYLISSYRFFTIKEQEEGKELDMICGSPQFP